MYIAHVRDTIRTILSDSTITDSEIDTAIDRAIADIDRFFPLEKAAEFTVNFNVQDEQWTATNDWVQLKYHPIQFASEIVKNSTGEVCKRDTDYEMDYYNGRIKIIPGGKIIQNDNCTISYSKSRICIDISGLNAIKINRVEYPYGEVPQSFCAFTVEGDILTLIGIHEESQSKLSQGKHLVVYYTTQHSPPTSFSRGSYPPYMDNVIIRGAAAYTYGIKLRTLESTAEEYIRKSDALLSSIGYNAVDNAISDAREALGYAISDLSDIVGLNNSVTQMVNSINTKIAQTDTVLSNAISIISIDISDIMNSIMSELADIQPILEDSIGIIESVPELLSNSLSYVSNAVAILESTSTELQKANDMLDGTNLYVEDIKEWINDSKDFIEKADDVIDFIEGGGGATRFDVENDLAWAKNAFEDAEQSLDTAFDLWTDENKLITGANASSWPSVFRYMVNTAEPVLNTTVMNSYITGNTAPSMRKYLDDGDDKINTINVGDSVAEMYARFSAQAGEIPINMIRIGAQYTNMASIALESSKSYAKWREDKINEGARYTELGMGYVQISAIRLQIVKTYFEQSELYMRMAEGVLNMTNNHMNLISAICNIVSNYIDKARTKAYISQGYSNIISMQLDAAKSHLEIADKYMNIVRAKLEIAGGYINTIGQIGELANSFINAASGYLAECRIITDTANIILGQIDRVLSSSSAYVSIANSHYGAAQKELEKNEKLISESLRYNELISQVIALIDRYRVSYTEMKEEFYRLLTNRLELQGKTITTSSPKQIK